MPGILARALMQVRKKRSVILAYHGIGKADQWTDPQFLLVAPDRFRMQVELLLQAGFSFRTVAELAALAADGVPPPGLAALSFDDGWEDNYSVALPILCEYGLPATVFVTTGLMGRRNPWLRDSSARMLTGLEVQELARAGVEIGAHTVTHADLSTLDAEHCLVEMLESRRTLEELVQRDVSSFAYPFCRFSADAKKAARTAGFAAAVTCSGRGSWDPLELRRSMIAGSDSRATFVLKVSELYYSLRQAPAMRLIRASTRSARRRLRQRSWRP